MLRIKTHQESFNAILFRDLVDAWSQSADALAEAMTELKLSQGFIVTRNKEEQIQVNAGTIDVVPAWRSLPNLPEGA